MNTQLASSACLIACAWVLGGCAVDAAHGDEGSTPAEVTASAEADLEPENGVVQPGPDRRCICPPGTTPATPIQIEGLCKRQPSRCQERRCGRWGNRTIVCVKPRPGYGHPRPN